MKYGRFFAMIATSTVVMFGLMYLNTYLITHVFWSETRAYMAILMGATMAIIMLAFMLSMYSNKTLNVVIFIGAAIVFAGSLLLVRSQITVGDRSFMRAMIPHHSIAIMTSSRANLSDPRVQKLADGIVYAQDKEIAEMRYLISDIGRNGDADKNGEQPVAQVMSLKQALSTPEIGLLDPEFLSSDEVSRGLPDGAACSFSYTDGSKPVVAVGTGPDGASALIKISGDLVMIPAKTAGTPTTSTEFETEGLSMALSGRDGEPLEQGPGQHEAVLTLKIGTELNAGYSGFYICAP